MKIHTPVRPNYSRSAKLCDQNLYHVSTPNYEQPKGYESTSSMHLKKANENYFFKSVSRQKRGNFRFKIIDAKGQFIYYPDHHYGKPKSPSWTTSKQEKYQNEKFVEYEFCQKHPQVRESQETKMNQTQSMKSFVHEKIKMKKSNSMISTNADFQKNYSIIAPRKTSRSEFFNQSKIRTSRYLSKSQVNSLEAQQDQKLYTQRLFSNKKGLVEFNRQLNRKPNVVRKQFQFFVKSYDHEDQFNNFQMTRYPTNPQHHIDFGSQLKREELFRESKLGPNSQVPSIDFTRRKESNMNYKLSTFRQKIRTRYDRTEPEPNTRIDIDLPKQRLNGMVTMNKVISRQKQLFPIVDPIIKKSGDKEMKEELKKSVFNFEINEAHRPDNPDIAIRKALN